VQYRDQVKIQNENEILGVKETAKFLHCSPSHVSNILNGRTNLPPIPHVRAGRKRLIRKASLLEWFKAQETASLETAARC
jgi:AraC-like DNA-binding protein